MDTHSSKPSKTPSRTLWVKLESTISGPQQEYARGQAQAALSSPTISSPQIDAVNQIGTDSWIGETHILLLMDDTAIVASSLDKLKEKLTLLFQSTEAIGMSINVAKSKFIAVNDNDV